jgi:two-component system cell cycle response regulator
MAAAPYCEQFGFDAQQRRRWLELLEFGDSDGERMKALHRQVIDPNIESTVDRFYQYLKTQPEYERILDQGYEMDRLKEALRSYLSSLGIGYDSVEYFEDRLRIGAVHARIGLSLSLYVCAYQILTRLVLDVFGGEKAGLAVGAFTETLLRVLALDESLAVETYYRSKVEPLQESVDSLRERGRALRDRIATDALTRVASYSHTIGLLRRAMMAARRSQDPLCVVMADLDFFKRVNDTHGHLVGDMVLRDTAARMQSALRNFDIIGRYGGEEFLVILEKCPLSLAHDIVDRMRHRVGSTPLHVDGINIHMTLSAGIAAMGDNDTVSGLIERADTAMYEAKERGRDRVCVASEHSGIES